jgi:hypothetical protein
VIDQGRIDRPTFLSRDDPQIAQQVGVDLQCHVRLHRGLLGCYWPAKAFYVALMAGDRHEIVRPQLPVSSGPWSLRQKLGFSRILERTCTQAIHRRVRLRSMEARLMSVDPRLDIWPQFQIRAISLGTENALITGTFSRVEATGVGDRGWLFVSEPESSIADIVTLEGKVAGLDVPNWSMTDHLHQGAILPWLDSRWQARDLALLLDRTREWQRIKYEATDAIVFAKKTLMCAKSGWAGDATRMDLLACPKCSSELKQVEIFGNQEAAFPLDADARFVETRPRFWDHDHCLICDLAIGRDETWGYRESSFADGPNSVGLWLCERCFDRYLGRQDFSFLVRGSANG